MEPADNEIVTDHSLLGSGHGEPATQARRKVRMPSRDETRDSRDHPPLRTGFMALLWRNDLHLNKMRKLVESIHRHPPRAQF
jgi:hypothetical protein